MKPKKYIKVTKKNLKELKSQFKNIHFVEKDKGFCIYKGDFLYRSGDFGDFLSVGKNVDVLDKEDVNMNIDKLYEAEQIIKWEANDIREKAN